MDTGEPVNPLYCHLDELEGQEIDYDWVDIRMQCVHDGLRHFYQTASTCVVAEDGHMEPSEVIAENLLCYRTNDIDDAQCPWDSSENYWTYNKYESLAMYSGLSDFHEWGYDNPELSVLYAMLYVSLGNFYNTGSYVCSGWFVPDNETETFPLDLALGQTDCDYPSAKSVIQSHCFYGLPRKENTCGGIDYDPEVLYGEIDSAFEGYHCTDYVLSPDEITSSLGAMGAPFIMSDGVIMNPALLSLCV